MTNTISEFVEEHNIGRLFIDIDGCIFHSCQAVADILNERYKTSVRGEDITDWDFKCCFPDMTSEEVEDVFNDPKFFDIVKPIDGALEFLNKYKDDKEIYLITKSNPMNYVYKRKWFDEHELSDIPIISLPLNVSKAIIDMHGSGEYKYSLFIDDNVHNLKKCWYHPDYRIMFKEYDDNKEREWQIGWGIYSKSREITMYKWQ